MSADEPPESEGVIIELHCVKDIIEPLPPDAVPVASFSVPQSAVAIPIIMGSTRHSGMDTNRPIRFGRRGSILRVEAREHQVEHLRAWLAKNIKA